MKIAFVFDAVYPYNKGGAEKRVWEIAQRLAQRGHEVHLYGMRYWDGDEVCVKDGVYLHGVCPVQELYIDGRRSIKEAIYFAYKLLGPLFRERFDIIDCSNFPYFPCFTAKLHSLMKGSTLVITWLEVWDRYWLEYLGKRGVIGRLVERLTARLSCNVIAISETTKRDLMTIGATGDIAVLLNGVDSEQVANVSPSENHSDIVFAGRLIRHKNVDVLLRAVSLITTHSPRVSCLIIGDGPEKRRLQSLARDLELESNVHFAGFLTSSEDVFSYMKSSRVFVFPSTREGFGIAVVEANACGLPVVTVRHPKNAACDLVVESENGFLCDLDEEDMAEKITTALERQRSMSAGCVEYAKGYEWDKIVDTFEHFYLSIFNQGRRSN